MGPRGRKKVTKEWILSEIRRTAKEQDGIALGKARFAQETGIQEWDWAGRYWTRWSEALQEAGYEPNQLQQRRPDDEVLEELANFVRDLGHFPTVNELKMRAREGDGFPSHNVFARWGPKKIQVARLAEYCNERAGYEAVLDALPLTMTGEDETHADEGIEQESAWGEVYLLKSGRYYKVGRSSSTDRRERELRLLLPERATRIHVIRTDDPVGIERYWHERFASRRKNGEWFELARDDVLAFRRRKFM